MSAFIKYNYAYITHHICNLIFFPLNSTVLILKSIPIRKYILFTFIYKKKKIFRVFNKKFLQKK